MPNSRNKLTHAELLALEIEEAWQVLVDEDVGIHRDLKRFNTEAYRLMNLVFRMGFVKGRQSGQRAEKGA